MRLLPLAALALAAGTAHAEPSVTTYAIVVGSNAGGPGQATLKYAEDDARKVAGVLTELGGYKPEMIDVIEHPTPDQLRDHLAKLAARVKADVAAGKQARVFFYYSGHARASGIDLGNGELPISELRQKLFEVPAALTVVVLDACQSGAFSNVKGASPAADFSYSSKTQLDATGVAVLASSSGSELSQESEQLRGSYFTHHLLVGLRGAGDANNDGQVSIDEAYRYAYHQTLLATAETAVGGQHVTFEADLKGHGEVPLSFPRAATAHIELPANLQGKTLVENKKAHTVVAETYKAKGGAVRIAVAPGEYDVLVRDGNKLSRCPVTAPGTIELARCREEAIVADTAKGGEADEHWVFDPHDVMFGVHVLVGAENHDGYTKNLENFGYTEDSKPSTGLAVQAFWHPPWGLRRLYFGGTVSMATLPEWKHSIVGQQNLSQTLEGKYGALMFTARVEDDWPLSWVTGYAELSAGIGAGGTDLHAADGMTYHDNGPGFAWAAAAGVRAHISRFAIDLGYEYNANYSIKDLIGNTHAAGGNRVLLGASVEY